MEILQNMKLLAELIQCGGSIFTWCYNEEGALLGSNCPDVYLNYLVARSRCWHTELYTTPLSLWELP